MCLSFHSPKAGVTSFSLNRPGNGWRRTILEPHMIQPRLRVLHRARTDCISRRVTRVLTPLIRTPTRLLSMCVCVCVTVCVCVCVCVCVYTPLCHVAVRYRARALPSGSLARALSLSCARSLYLSIYPYKYPSIYIPITYIYPYIYPYIYIYIYIHIYIYIYIYISIYIHIYIHISSSEMT